MGRNRIDSIERIQFATLSVALLITIPISIVLMVAAEGPTCPIKCKTNEIYQTCGTRCERICSINNGNLVACTKDCAPPACYCIDGFVRKNGVCVKPNACKSIQKKNDAHQLSISNKCTNMID